MSSNTPNIGLYKVNPATDGNLTFNIETMLNENWDKIDVEFGNMPKKDGTLQVGLNAEKVGGKKVGELAPASHTHTKANITDFTHTHTKANITDFTHTHTKANITDFAHTHNINEITNLFGNIPRTFKIVKSNKDSNGIYTQVDYKREDGTLYMRSVLSGGTSPQYTTRTITVYDTDGTTVLQTITHTLTYDSDGNVVSEL